MKQLMTLILLLSVFSIPTSYASKEVGNGGNGLLMNGVPVVLDLVEAGVDTAPFFDDSIEINHALLLELKKGLPQFPETHKLMARKLSEIEKISPPIAWALAESFRLFNIRVVNETLVNIHDDDSVVDYDPSVMVQLAIRRGTSIFLNGTWWPKMQPEQKVALLLHEMVYAFQNTVKKKVGNDTEDVQLSTPARAITGLFFTSEFPTLGADGLKRVLFNQSRLAAYFDISAKSQLTESRLEATRIFIRTKNASLYHYSEYLGDISKSTSQTELKAQCLNLSYFYLGFSIELNNDPRMGLELRNIVDSNADTINGCMEKLNLTIKNLPQ